MHLFSLLCSLLLLLLFATQLESAFALDRINFCSPAHTPKELTIPHYFMKHNVSQQFGTRIRDINCSSSNITIASSSVSEPSFYFLPSGDIVIPEEHYFVREEFCISRFEEEQVEIKHCAVKCGVTHTCIRKCCPPKEIVDLSKDWAGAPCGSSRVLWKPVFYDTHEGCGSRTKSSVNFHLLPTSESHIGSIQPYHHISYRHLFDGLLDNKTTHVEGSRFRLMAQGHLKVQRIDGDWVEIGAEDFCIDAMTGYLGSGPYRGDLKDQMVLFLDLATAAMEANATNESYEEEYDFLQEEEEEHQEGGRLAPMYITLMFFGAVFLISTSVLYLLIWEKHNIHGWTIFAFVTTMFFMFIFLAVSNIFSLSVTDEFGATSACKAVGVLSHFFYLSTMCWLTVINMDLWLTFRNVKPTQGRSQNFVRFFLYSLFAIGIPMLIVTIAVTLDRIYAGGFGDGSECEPPVTLPLYGKHRCYIQNIAYWPYLFIPMSILISCNILTFSSTVFTLCLYRNHTRAVASAGHQKESVVLFGKLFIVTGISWVFELVSNTFPDPWWLWLIFDTYNLLQAVLIFIIFACKRENLLCLFHKYPMARRFLLPIMRTPCCYSRSFDPERTEMTALPYDYRNSRISYRRGSNFSTAGMISSSSNGNSIMRRGSTDS